MGILDNLNLEGIKDKVTDLAQAGVSKSKQLAEIAKLKTNNMGEEDTIKKAYLELGRLYYAERGAAPEGAYAAACGRISQAKATIETNNARIAELKAQGYTHIFFAVGAWRAGKLDISGNIMPVIGWLQDLKAGKSVSLGQVAVGGGGNTAMDAARAALRAGAKSSTLV